MTVYGSKPSSLTPKDKQKVVGIVVGSVLLILILVASCSASSETSFTPHTAMAVDASATTEVPQAAGIYDSPDPVPSKTSKAPRAKPFPTHKVTPKPTRKPTPTHRVTPKPTVKPKPKPTTPSHKNYANCTALRKDFPNGVPEGHWAYTDKMDRDNDGRACERS